MVAIAAHVTRTSLSLPNLDLLSATHKLIEELAFGTVAWNRITATSPFVDGDVPVHRTKSPSQLSMGVNVVGASQSALSSNVNVLLNAFYEDNYELHISYDGVDWAWKCYAAEALVGAMDDRFDLLNVEVRFLVPRHPVPVAGPF